MEPLTGEDAVRSLVTRHLTRLHGSTEVDRDRDFVVRRDGVTAWVRVVGVQPEMTLVRVFTVLPGPLARLDDACAFLARESLDVPIGHFIAHDSGRIGVVHTLLGEYLSAEELRAGVDGVISLAATYGPQVALAYGGPTATDSNPPAANPATEEAVRQLLAQILAQSTTTTQQSTQQSTRPRPHRDRRRDVAVGAMALLLVVAVLVLGLSTTWWAAGWFLTASLIIARAVARRLRGAKGPGWMITSAILVVLGGAVLAGGEGEGTPMTIATGAALMAGPLLGVGVARGGVRAGRSR